MKPTKIIYDPETRTLTLRLLAGRVEESDEVTPGVIADYDSRGRVIAVEVLLPPKAGEPELSVAHLPYTALLSEGAAKKSAVRERPVRAYRSR